MFFVQKNDNIRIHRCFKTDLAHQSGNVRLFQIDTNALMGWLVPLGLGISCAKMLYFGRFNMNITEKLGDSYGKVASRRSCRSLLSETEV